MIVTKQLEENPPPPQLIWEPRLRKYLDKLNPWVLSLVIMFPHFVGYTWLNPGISFKLLPLSRHLPTLIMVQ